MQIPLDKICVKSGVLCDKCKAKIDSGKYQRWEVDVMRALLNLEGSYKELRNASYRKSVIVGDTLYIVLDNVKLVSRQLARSLEKELANLNIKRVFLVAGSSDPKRLIESLLPTSQVLSVNTYYAPDGSTYYIAKLPLSDRWRVSEVERAAQAVFKSLSGSDLFIEYEEGHQSPRAAEGLGEKVDKEKLNEIMKRIERQSQ
ncbi:MAG: hypothetical protein RXO27_00045 [Acidilobus sp.]